MYPFTYQRPGTLADALAALAADPVVTGWFSPRFIECYFGMKRKEIEIVAGLEGQALCDRYAAVY